MKLQFLFNYSFPASFLKINPVRANFFTPFSDNNGWRIYRTLWQHWTAGFGSSTLPPSFWSTAPQELPWIAVVTFCSSWSSADLRERQRSIGARITRTKFYCWMFQSQQKQLTTLWTAKLSHKVANWHCFWRTVKGNHQLWNRLVFARGSRLSADEKWLTYLP